MSLLLTRDELQELTDRRTRAGVVAWLRSRGWVYELGATGWPKVSATYAAQRLGVTSAGAPTAASTEPDWSALRAA